VGQCIPPPRHVLPVSRYTDPDPDPHPDPYRHQNLIICSLAYCQPPQNFMQILWENLRKVANRETNNGENITSLAEVGNKMLINKEIRVREKQFDKYKKSDNSYC